MNAWAWGHLMMVSWWDAPESTTWARGLSCACERREILGSECRRLLMVL
jgi:hypothetical protein